jgi:hypothetical protein
MTAMTSLLTGGWVVFLYSDVACEYPLKDMLEFHRARGAEATILVTKVNAAGTGMLARKIVHLKLRSEWPVHGLVASYPYSLLWTPCKQILGKGICAVSSLLLHEHLQAEIRYPLSLRGCTL